jgi:hypothetical protein
MRTTDFSRAPDIGQAGAQFVGATNFRHRVWFRFPFTFGTIAFFTDRDALLTFARCPEHARLMQWVMEPGNARGGFIRFWEVLPDGYSSGVWRAESPHEMKAIERFTHLEGENEPPLVAHRARPRPRR